MGLRLVGLLPCAVWAPKVPKPTIASQTRPTPYTLTSPNRTENCRCASTSTQLRPPAPVAPALRPPAPAVVATPVPAPVIVPPRVATQQAPAPRNSMLLVPFAVPGFVPIQQQQHPGGQQSGQTSGQQIQQPLQHVQQPTTAMIQSTINGTAPSPCSISSKVRLMNIPHDPF